VCVRERICITHVCIRVNHARYILYYELCIAVIFFYVAIGWFRACVGACVCVCMCVCMCM